MSLKHFGIRMFRKGVRHKNEGCSDSLFFAPIL